MSKQKFSAVQRESLWVAHDKKCAYTRVLLDVSSFHIDHILPESLADKPDEFEKTKTELGLNSSFNINGYENLLPCQPGINLQKGSLIFDPASIRYYLNIALAKKPRIEANLVDIEHRNTRAKALILLQQCLESGKVSPSEVIEILANYNDKPGDIFQLLEGLRFANSDEIRAIKKADIGELLNRTIKLGQNDDIVGVTLTNDANDKIQVRTCKEYEDASNQEYYALTTFDIKMATFFEQQCGLLKALQKATIPERSFINSGVSILNIELLPYSLFPDVDYEPEKMNVNEITYQTKINQGAIAVKRLRQNLLCVEQPEGMGQQLIEVARADFNGDGIEDILLFQYCYATHGTLGYGGIKILTRTTNYGLFEIVM